EEVVAAITIEDHLTIARASDDDRLIGRAAPGEIVRAVELGAVCRAAAVESAVDETIVFVETGMNEDRIAGLHAQAHRARVVRFIGSEVIRREQPGESRLLSRTRVGERIDVIDRPARGG